MTQYREELHAALAEGEETAIDAVRAVAAGEISYAEAWRQWKGAARGKVAASGRAPLGPVPHAAAAAR